MKVYQTIFLIVLLLALSSCLDSAQLFDEKRVSILFNVNNIGTSLEAGDDLIVINEFKFAIDRFTISSEEISLGTQDRITALLFIYEEVMEGSILVIDVGLGISDNAIFDTYEMFLEPVASRSGILDDDFFSDDGNYSIVIKGEINDNSFVYNSSREFEKTFNFTPASLTEINETLVLRKSIDILEVLFDENGEFLDPRIESNDVKIVDNINTYLTITAAAEDIF